LWSAEEKAKFAVAIKLFGRNWTLIADYLDYSKREKECKEYFEGQFSAARKKHQQNLQSLEKEGKKLKSSDYTTLNDDSTTGKKKQIYSHYWTKEEKRAFSDAFSKYGKNWEAISKAIKSKSANQSKKFFKKNKNLFESEQEVYEEQEKTLEDTASSAMIEEDVDIEDFASSSPFSLQPADVMPVIKLPTLF
jgi:hypothetical protein